MDGRTDRGGSPGSPHRVGLSPARPRGAERDSGRTPERREGGKRERVSPPQRPQEAPPRPGAPSSQRAPRPARPRPPLLCGTGRGRAGGAPSLHAPSTPRSPENAPGSEWAVSGPWLGASSPGQGRWAGAGGGSRAGAAAPHTAAGRGWRRRRSALAGERPGGLASLFLPQLGAAHSGGGITPHLTSLPGSPQIVPPRGASSPRPVAPARRSPSLNAASLCPPPSNPAGCQGWGGGSAGKRGSPRPGCGQWRGAGGGCQSPGILPLLPHALT